MGRDALGGGEGGGGVVTGAGNGIDVLLDASDSGGEAELCAFDGEPIGVPIVFDGGGVEGGVGEEVGAGGTGGAMEVGREEQGSDQPGGKQEGSRWVGGAPRGIRSTVHFGRNVRSGVVGCKGEGAG